MLEHHIIFATAAGVGRVMRSSVGAGGGPIWPLLLPIVFGLGILVGLWLSDRNRGRWPGGGGWRWRRPGERPRPPDPIGEDGEDRAPAWIAEVERYLARQAHHDPGHRT